MEGITTRSPSMGAGRNRLEKKKPRLGHCYGTNVAGEGILMGDALWEAAAEAQGVHDWGGGENGSYGFGLKCEYQAA